jgi:uncharacterized YccA/Bax inhibitor family protein
MASGNPAANEEIYRRAATEPAAAFMTIQGTAIKGLLLVGLLVLTFGYSWYHALAAIHDAAEGAAVGTPPALAGMLMGGFLGGFVVALITCFSPRLSPFTAPLYAALEGLALGALSAFFNARYPGIVFQAVTLTVGTLAAMLVLFASRIIRVTERFRIGIIAATGGICLVYLASFILGFFGMQVPFLHDTGPIGIGISVVVVVVAAFNLLLDFDSIERGAQYRAPKYMEWYGGFSLLVTLVWLYLEMLRLLAKLRSDSR